MAVVDRNVRPAYEPTNVARSLGAQRTHLVAYGSASLLVAKWIGPTFWSLPTPWLARCGARLTQVVLMRDGTKTSCPTCKRLGAAS